MRASGKGLGLKWLSNDWELSLAKEVLRLSPEEGVNGVIQSGDKRLARQRIVEF